MIFLRNTVSERTCGLSFYARHIYFRKASDLHLPATLNCASDSPRKTAADGAPTLKL